jgi:hypothetical protein
MSDSKFCKTCQFWLPAFERDKKFGTCDHPTVDGLILVDKEHDAHSENTVIHTEETFGCVYHTPNHGNVVTKL